MPVLDGAYYLEWARALATGQGGPTGAYYLPPLYPYLLRIWLGFGESFSLLYGLQQVAMVATGALLALVGRRLTGEGAALAAAALFLTYHPTLYFASRPIGEPLAILLLALSLWLYTREGAGAGGAAGFSVGIAALARPNLLLIAILWLGREALRKPRARAMLLALGVVLAVLPVTVRNAVVSGHRVVVSSNAGITLYHGNGPGSAGIFTSPAGFSGSLGSQREEATRMASYRSGREMDPVEADRWWGRQAVEERLAHPGSTMRLLSRRCLLLLANAEPGLAYTPSIDDNPLRRAAPVPFALILGLSAAGLYLGGARGSGGAQVWSVVLACAAMPLLFYVSSRYRLPMTTFLCLPAGVGLVRLGRPAASSSPTRRWIGLGIVAACAALSILIPVNTRLAEAGALSNRATAWGQMGNRAAAEADLRRALARDPSSVPALFTFGRLLETEGRLSEAKARYRQALAANPASAEAAANLGSILTREGQVAEAVSVLERALRARPHHEVCWTNLVVALSATGDYERARAAAARARSLGVELDPGLLQYLENQPVEAVED